MRRTTLILLGSLLISSVRAQMSIEPQGQLGGEPRTVVLSQDGSLAYFGLGHRVIIQDLSDPNGSREIGKSPVLPQVVEDIVVVGRHVFVADGEAGLYVLDVSNPAAPTVAGHYETPGEPSWVRGLRVSVSGKHAYLADGMIGVHVLDISDPIHPARVATIEIPDDYPWTYAYDVVVSEGYAYVALGDRGLMVADVSDPMHPRVITLPDETSSICAMEIAGRYLYATGAAAGSEGTQRMWVIDVQDPSNPAVVGACDVQYAGNLAITDKFAYVANAWMGVEFVRITDPKTPARVAAYRSNGCAIAVAVKGGQLFVGASYSGLEIVDISNLASPTLKETYKSTNVTDVAVSDSLAYVVSAYTGLQVVDINDPTSPQWVSEVDFDYANCLAVYKDCAWVGDGPQFVAVDVSNSRLLKVTHACDLGEGIYDIAVQGSYAYAASGHQLVVVDVSNRFKPAVAATYPVSGYTWGLCLTSQYAYVAGDGGLDIIDISNPLAPSLVANYVEQGDYPEDVAVCGNYIFLANGNKGLRVVDVSDPWLPGRVREIDTFCALGMTIEGQYGFLTDMEIGLQIFDVTNPGDLTPVGGYESPGFCRNVAVSGDHILMANEPGGLMILKMDKPAEDTVNP